MQLFIPYTKVNAPTWEPLARFSPVGVDVSGDDTAYLRFWAQRWHDRRPFIVVEHDMTNITARHIYELMGCEQPWCAAAYDAHPGQFPWFGLVRFRTEMMDRFPDVWDQLIAWADAPRSDPVWRLVGEVPIKGPPNGEWSVSEFRPAWQHLDQWWVRAAQRQGVQCHRHYPDVHNDRSLDR
jgi:hypothetical protein